MYVTYLLLQLILNKIFLFIRSWPRRATRVG